MSVLRKFFNQTRKPEGRLGRIMLRTMNAGHAKMADWGMSHLPQISPENIVELGCGAGRNAGELLKRYPKAHVTAVSCRVMYRRFPFPMDLLISLRHSKRFISGRVLKSVFPRFTGW